MNVQQKVAWYNLGVLAAAVVIYGILVPFLGAVPALGAFGICGLWGLGILFYRRGRGEVLVDERDRLVSLRAQVAGLWVFWECFIAACMITWAVLRYGKGQHTVPVEILPAMVFGAMIVFLLTHSIAVLAQYGRSRGDAS